MTEIKSKVYPAANIEEVGDSIVLTKENVKEVIIRLNEFFKSSVVYTHDWLKHPMKEDTPLELLTFRDYKKYHLSADIKWGESDLFAGILLDQEDISLFLFKIIYGQKIVFKKDELFVFETPESSGLIDSKSLVEFYCK